MRSLGVSISSLFAGSLQFTYSWFNRLLFGRDGPVHLSVLLVDLAKKCLGGILLFLLVTARHFWRWIELDFDSICYKMRVFDFFVYSGSHSFVFLGVVLTQLSLV